MATLRDSQRTGAPRAGRANSGHGPSCAAQRTGAPLTHCSRYGSCPVHESSQGPSQSREEAASRQGSSPAPQRPRSDSAQETWEQDSGFPVSLALHLALLCPSNLLLTWRWMDRPSFVTPEPGLHMHLPFPQPGGRQWTCPGCRADLHLLIAPVLLTRISS